MQSLFSPSYLKSLCAEYHLTPSKKYGQNYLVSEGPIKKMIEAGELTSQDTVVEIGPGFGVLTLSMAPEVHKLIAFEIEKKLVPYWEAKKEEYPNIDIVWGNALHQLASHVSAFQGGYKVLANLPYQITSYAIRTLLESSPQPERIILMVQKEVAERICAKKGDMSLLAVSVQYYGDPRIVAKVSKGSFWPSPKVDSAVLAITNITAHADAAVFFQFATAGFHNKRKQLWRNISSTLSLPADEVKQALIAVVGNEKIRAEALDIDEWKALVSALTPLLTV